MGRREGAGGSKKESSCAGRARGGERAQEEAGAKAVALVVREVELVGHADLYGRRSMPFQGPLPTQGVKSLRSSRKTQGLRLEKRLRKIIHGAEDSTTEQSGGKAMEALAGRFHQLSMGP